ncbi:acetolactate decarboxylase [Exiguobacterium acetylicum]|uniref:acetolactate decarboxylase n=1 Tax=Exiguobacterium acetylicum TaxID=41170 RepID=UPI001EE28BA0|nr:acetolactate decarboxylase [Exiguobacterium acetylicum]UKS55372.1 acetolactate decarboxylase [Exiguobacterium acetylicum]
MAHDKTLVQISTMMALLDGVFESDVTYASVLDQRDFGIGTFDHLDGEMIGFDGQFYQLRSDGSARPLQPETTTPFATLTRFEPEQILTVTEEMSKATFEHWLNEQLPTINSFYAIRIDGTFTEVQTRTVARQEKPFVPITEAVASQSARTFKQTEGTLAGYYTPRFGHGIAVAGYHLHFIDAAREGGGHVFDYTVKNVTVTFEEKPHLDLRLPTTEAYRSADLESHDIEKEIKIAEG